MRHPDKPINARVDLFKNVDDTWIVEPKIDGYRCNVVKYKNKLSFISRKGITFKVKSSIFDHFKDLPDDTIIDTEWINESRIKAINSQFKLSLPLQESIGVFDVMQWSGKWMGKSTLKDRLSHDCFNKLPTPNIDQILNHDVFRIPSISGLNAHSYFESLKEYLITEGVVVKKLNSLLVGSTSKSADNNGWFKVKFRDAK